MLNHGDTLRAMLVEPCPADLLAIFRQGPSKGICERMAKSQCQNDRSEHPMILFVHPVSADVFWWFQVE